MGSLHVGLLSRRAYRCMLKKDGRWWQWRSRLRLWQMVGRFFRKVGGAMLRATRPSYHPDKVTDPTWVEDWRRAYTALAPGESPLLDTRSAGLPAVFTTPTATGFER